jgi:hypothetical protein
MDYSIQRRIGHPGASVPDATVGDMLSETLRIVVPVFDVIGEKGVLVREFHVLPDGGQFLGIIRVVERHLSQVTARTSRCVPRLPPDRVTDVQAELDRIQHRCVPNPCRSAPDPWTGLT